MYALVDYEEVYKEIAARGSVLGIYNTKSSKYVAGIVNEFVAFDSGDSAKSAARLCTWGNFVRLQPNVSVSDKDKSWRDVLAAPKCTELSRITGEGNLDYRRIGEDWLDVVRVLEKNCKPK
jgi:hypothetical protein